MTTFRLVHSPPPSSQLVTKFGKQWNILQSLFFFAWLRPRPVGIFKVAVTISTTEVLETVQLVFSMGQLAICSMSEAWSEHKVCFGASLRFTKRFWAVKSHFQFLFFYWTLPNSRYKTPPAVPVQSSCKSAGPPACPGTRGPGTPGHPGGAASAPWS